MSNEFSYNRIAVRNGLFYVIANYNWMEDIEIFADPSLVYASFHKKEEAVEWMEKQDIVDSLAMEYSDMFKDTYGVRPRGVFECLDGQNQDYQIEFYKKALVDLEPALERSIQEEKDRQQEAIANFEEEVEVICRQNGVERETAIRWMADANRCGTEYANRDTQYVEFCFGLPYGYLKEMV